MNIITICNKCKGSGIVRSYIFFHKVCPKCKGARKFKSKLADRKNK